MKDLHKLIYISDCASAKTGFGNVSLQLLSKLYKTGRFQILHICQGMVDGHPDFQKFPWQCVGALPNDQNEINRLNQDQFLARQESYANSAADRWVREFKPKTLIWVNDPWGSSDLLANKKFNNKINSIAWVTLDSTPLYQPCLDNIDKLKNLYVWSSFATEEFAKLGHTVKTIFPPVDTEKYKPITSTEKRELREKFGVPKDSFIDSYFFRSQLRKQSHSIIEAYGLLEKNSPEIAKNTYLYFHTSLSEGWDHKRFCKRYNVDYHKILFTWLCQQCKNISIKIDDDDKNCKCCGAEKSLTTPNVMFGADSNEMYQLYGIADCFTLVANSGATELPGVESMSCAVPLATIDYSYGHDFCKNDFVYTLDASKSIEFGTQFEKMTPSAWSIMKFIKKIYELPVSKRAELGKKSRQWIIDNFDVNKVAKDWENILDNLPEVNWDYSYEEQRKNENYPFQKNNLSDTEFVVDLYKNVLLCDGDQEGISNWTQGLLHGRTREQVYSFFIETARKQNSESGQQNQINLEDLFDKNDPRKRVLLVLPQSYGDHVIFTSLVPSIIEKYPREEYAIYLAAEQKYWEVYSGNNDIKLIPYAPIMDNEMIMTGAGQDKGIVNVYILVPIATQKILNYLTNKY